jgi:hypothetical protein
MYQKIPSKHGTLLVALYKKNLTKGKQKLTS